MNFIHELAERVAEKQKMCNEKDTYWFLLTTGGEKLIEIVKLEKKSNLNLMMRSSGPFKTLEECKEVIVANFKFIIDRTIEELAKLEKIKEEDLKVKDFLI